MTGETIDPRSDRTVERDSTMPGTETPVVLLVEDETDYVEMYSEWLGQEYDVIVARSGREAIERITDAIDVVILDRRLPDTSGLTVLEEIRDRDLTCQVVVVSAVDPGVDVLDAGFDDYLTKPTTEADLTAAVERSITRMTYARKHREFHALATKLATIEANMEVPELEACAEYIELRARFSEMVEALGTMAVDDEEYRDLYDTKLHVLLDSTRSTSPNY